ncbi:hypothetical protein FEM48_Zijuj03G0132600 [Ziziphus jujuba var. spinosa]|uniref:Uncharacterized protein n=1 Tax=Ziziphus jujuba var. spinosa TaxID=714518 RepID=A0A978VQI4_ZIZJJ|nr:hypothetical protein FEM48_Zijuj03G0132600 [Ziziphus jujuba var. spinosa]
MEAVGVLTAVGPGLSGRQVGDLVFYAGNLMGSYAEEYILPANKVVPVPSSIGPIMLKGMAASFFSADASSSLHSGILMWCFMVEAGQTVLVHAVAGGVGSLLCQWANALCATVIGTVSTKRMQLKPRKMRLIMIPSRIVAILKASWVHGEFWGVIRSTRSRTIISSCSEISVLNKAFCDAITATREELLETAGDVFANVASGVPLVECLQQEVLNLQLLLSELYIVPDLVQGKITTSTILPPPLPPVCNEAFACRTEFCLAFGPSRSPYCKLVNTGPFPSDLLFYNVVFDDGIYWNASVHWIGGWDSAVALYFNVDEERMSKMPLPTIPKEWEHWDELNFRYFGDSGDHLHLIGIYDPPTTQFNVYAIKRDYSSWFVKFHVDPDDLENLNFNVICVVRCELEEESHLVMRIEGVLIVYYLKTNTFNKLCDIDHDVDTYGLAYEYTESLAYNCLNEREGSSSQGRWAHHVVIYKEEDFVDRVNAIISGNGVCSFLQRLKIQ